MQRDPKIDCQINAHYSKADPRAGKQKSEEARVLHHYHELKPPQFLLDSYHAVDDSRTYWDAEGLDAGFQAAGKPQTVGSGNGKHHT